MIVEIDNDEAFICSYCGTEHDHDDEALRCCEDYK